MRGEQTDGSPDGNGRSRKPAQRRARANRPDGSEPAAPSGRGAGGNPQRTAARVAPSGASKRFHGGPRGRETKQRLNDETRRLRRVSQSPLPDSNRRPLPYHGSLPEIRELALPAKVPAQKPKPFPGRRGQRSAPFGTLRYPLGARATSQRLVNEASRRTSIHGVVGRRVPPGTFRPRTLGASAETPAPRRATPRPRCRRSHARSRRSCRCSRVDFATGSNSPADVRWSSSEPSGHRYEAWIECARSRERAASRPLCAGRPAYVERSTACAAK
jgi:hypothetical protein